MQAQEQEMKQNKKSGKKTPQTALDVASWCLFGRARIRITGTVGIHALIGVIFHSQIHKAASVNFPIAGRWRLWSHCL
jgi:hypothetical protein